MSVIDDLDYQAEVSVGAPFRFGQSQRRTYQGDERDFENQRLLRCCKSALLPVKVGASLGAAAVIEVGAGAVGRPCRFMLIAAPPSKRWPRLCDHQLSLISVDARMIRSLRSSLPCSSLEIGNTGKDIFAS